MNKILLLCAVFICTTIALQAQQTFTIKGKLAEVKEPQKIILKYSTGEKMITDTTMVINGAFSFRGKVQYPVKASLSLIPLRRGKKADKSNNQSLLDRDARQDFFVEQGQLTVSGTKNMKDALIKGGKTQGEFLQLKKQVEPLHDLQDESILKWKLLVSQKTEEAKKKYGPELTTEQQNEAMEAARKERPTESKPINFYATITKLEHDFISQHPDSYVSFDLVSRYASIARMDFKTFDSIYNSLSQRLRDTEETRRLPFHFCRAKLQELPLEELKSAYSMLGQYKNTSLATEADEIAKLFLRRIKGMEAAVTAIGSPAIPIKKVDINGTPLNWDSFKGKYLLIDFWASWCGPCRKSHPHLKELYAKYKDKGFEMLGISDEGGSNTLEHKEKLWKAAIKKDGLPWPQVLNDIDREQYDAMEAYGIEVYGTKVLLDKEGKILGRYNAIDDKAELDKKLKEIFGY